MISIAYLIDALATPSAGTEKQLLMLLKHLDRNRFRPRLVCLRFSPWLEQAALPCPVDVLELDSLISLRSVVVGRAFRRHQQQHGFHILHTLFPDSCFIGPVLARTAGIPVTVSSRRNMGYWQAAYHRAAARVLRKWTTHYLANSEAAKHYAIRTEGIQPTSISVIYNGLETAQVADTVDSRRGEARASLGLSDDHVLIVSIANLRPVKNLPSLVEAAAIVSQRYGKVRFVVVGEGPERNKLEEMVVARELTDRFSLVGSTTDTLRYLAAADIAVQCSFSESFSNALIEYMASGLPIVASHVGGNGEAITHGETGLLYAGHTAVALAEELEKLLKDRGLASRLGQAARKSAQTRFSVRSCVEQTEALYEALLR